VVLDDLAAYLQTAGLGTVAVDIFKSRLPMDQPGVTAVDAAMALIPVPGGPPLYVHSKAAPDLAQPVVQVICRGTQYGDAAAMARAEQAWVALGSVHNQTLSSTFYLSIVPQQSPWLLKRDELDRPLIVFQVRCVKEAP